jgi:alpha-glucosidase (family GH31 glycosyl hydrolase)
VIRHRPRGRGHPYLLEADQRIPADPVAGEPFELRAVTDAGIGELRVELDRGGPVETVHAVRRPAEPTDAPPHAAARAAGETHLGVAAAAPTADVAEVGWSVELVLPESASLRYRFVASSEASPWFDLSLARPQARAGELVVTGEAVRHRVIPGTLSWLVADERAVRARFALRLDPGEHVVGFGERFDALDQRGRRPDCVVYEQYKGQGGRTYLPMPFAHVVGGSGWGFHVATSRRTRFDVGATEPDRLWIDVELGADPTVVLELYEGSPESVLARFLHRTGRPKAPPGWVFEPWMSANDWNTQERVLAEVEQGERAGIHAGVIVIEAWSDEQTFVAFADAQYEPHSDGSPHSLSDFTFPATGAWPDPKGLVDELHARGLRVLLWQIPLLKADAPPGSQGDFDAHTLVERGYAVREEDGSPYRNRGWWFPNALLPDFTHEGARAWWLARRRYLVEELGVDGFKTDGGEHAWGADLRYADGTRGDETNNRYPVLYAAAYHELFDELGRPGVTFSRAGFTGSASYSCHWAGDEDSTWEAFRASLTAGLTAGACGIFFWGWDLAGFSGEIPDAELYLRAAAAACFCPVMQYHSEFNGGRKPSRDRTPWNIAERTGDARVVPVYRRFAELRRRLVPYLHRQAPGGKPLMRALFFEYQDERIWAFPLEYLLGNDLLVAPVTAPGAETWPVLLPAGAWVDAWTGEELEGACTVERRVPLEEIPVYVRRAQAAELRPLFDV